MSLTLAFHLQEANQSCLAAGVDDRTKAISESEVDRAKHQGNQQAQALARNVEHFGLERRVDAGSGFVFAGKCEPEHLDSRPAPALARLSVRLLILLVELMYYAVTILRIHA